MESKGTMKLTIVSPEKTIFDGTVNRVTLPGELGSFTVFPGHASLISSLKTGNIKYVTTSGQTDSLEIQEGFVEINDGVISVCIEL